MSSTLAILIALALLYLSIQAKRPKAPRGGYQAKKRVEGEGNAPPRPMNDNYQHNPEKEREG